MNKNKKSFAYFLIPGTKVTIKVIRIIKNRPVEVGTIKDTMRLREFNKMSGSFKKSYPRLRAEQYLRKQREILPAHKTGRDYLIWGA